MDFRPAERIEGWGLTWSRWNSKSCTQASLTWAGAELSWKWSSDLYLLAVSARLHSAELRLTRISPLKCFCKKAQEPTPENPATKSTQIIRLWGRVGKVRFLPRTKAKQKSDEEGK